MRDLKYGDVRAERGVFHDDEPVFVIRAQDALAAEAIDSYRRLCAANGADRHHISSIEASRDAFLQWQRENTDKVKAPDTPAPVGSSNG